MAPLVIAHPALADDIAAATASGEAQDGAHSGYDRDAAAKPKAFTTGVAKGRDLLDSAISASALDESEISKLGARSFADILRTIPGIRAEAGSGEADGSYTIRGLPLAASGSKFLQLQEDGLPVLEFGDFNTLGSDLFLRYDTNVSQIQTIRGGSASTFASNSPGGVINLLSKTGDTPGGAIEFTSGLDYELYRVDADYGAKLSDTLRFHVGGFFRQGQGPRRIGYDAYRGGQVKFNVTKDLGGTNFIRLYGQYLNDRVPDYQPAPLAVSGTDANPHYSAIPNYDVRKDSDLSRNFRQLLGLDPKNRPITINFGNGLHAVVKSIGAEGQFDVAGWTLSDKIRYASRSGDTNLKIPLFTLPANALIAADAGPGGTASFADGPLAGQVIANPAALNGNGLLTQNGLFAFNLRFNNLVNDFRATRSWNVGGGSLTATVGTYHSEQNLDLTLFVQSAISDVRGGGSASLIDLTSAQGVKVTQGGTAFYSLLPFSSFARQAFDVKYLIDAPYGSLNYHVGRLSVGGSLRYDIGRVRGSVNSGTLGGGRVGITPFDINGDGVIAPPETSVAFLPRTDAAPVDYNYGYLSYSAGVNYRFSSGFAGFARYSRGARAGADRLLLSSAISPVTGKLQGYKGYDPVKQAEVGVKFREGALTLNLTGFWAKASDQNSQVSTGANGSAAIYTISRKYQAEGAEFEGAYSIGAFHIAGTATYTHAEIKGDATDSTLIGNTPRHQPKLIYSVTPQFEANRFTVGANVVGVTSSYTQDVNRLKMPAYATVNAFLQFRPFERLQVSVNANNLFNKLAPVEVTEGTIPQSGVVLARVLNGRTVSASIRLAY